MRKKPYAPVNNDISIMIIDDEQGIIESVSALLQRNGYTGKGFVNPMDGLEELSRAQYDLLILDYFMEPLHGDAVVEMIRKTNKELYILLLTGHKDLAPPLSTIKALDIQAYCEKSDRLDQLLLLVESGIKSIAQMRTIQKFRDGLNSILGAVPKIYQLQPIGNILEEILRQILPLVNSTDAFILVDDLAEFGNANKSIYRGIGAYHVPINRFTELLDPIMMENIGFARTSGKQIDMENGTIFPLENEYLNSIGVLYVEGKHSTEDAQLLALYASQAASSINNAFLHSLVNIKNEELNQTYAQLKTQYMDTIEVLRLAVDAKDVYTRGHSDRVAYYATKLGRGLSLTGTDLENLRIAGFFHDIGKIGTSDDILLKNDTLERGEYEEIKKHPLKGAHILSAVSMFQDVVPLVRQHHERIDGKGYPDGLQGKQINYLARIIAIADAFDAMTSDRHYRSQLTLQAAINQLKQGAGTQFDENMVQVFLEMLQTDEELKKNVAAPDFLR